MKAAEVALPVCTLVISKLKISSSRTNALMIDVEPTTSVKKIVVDEVTSLPTRKSSAPPPLKSPTLKTLPFCRLATATFGKNVPTPVPFKKLTSPGEVELQLTKSMIPSKSTSNAVTANGESAVAKNDGGAKTPPPVPRKMATWSVACAA